MRHLHIGSVGIPLPGLHILLALGGRQDAANQAVLLPAIEQMLAPQDDLPQHGLVIDPSGSITDSISDQIEPSELRVIKINGADYNPLQDAEGEDFAKENSDVLIQSEPYLASQRYQDDRMRNLIEVILRALQVAKPTASINALDVLDAINDPMGLANKALAIDPRSTAGHALILQSKELPDTLRLILKDKASVLLKPFGKAANSPFLNKQTGRSERVVILNGRGMDKNVLRLLAASLLRSFGTHVETKAFLACADYYEIASPAHLSLFNRAKNQGVKIFLTAPDIDSLRANLNTQTRTLLDHIDTTVLMRTDDVGLARFGELLSAKPLNSIGKIKKLFGAKVALSVYPAETFPKLLEADGHSANHFSEAIVHNRNRAGKTLLEKSRLIHSD